MPTIPPMTEAQVVSPRIPSIQHLHHVEAFSPEAQLSRLPASEFSSEGGRPVAAKSKGGFTTRLDRAYSWSPFWRRLDSPRAVAPPMRNHPTSIDCDAFPVFPLGQEPQRQNHYFGKLTETGDGSATARSGLASPRGGRRNGLWLTTAFVY